MPECRIKPGHWLVLILLLAAQAGAAQSPDRAYPAFTKNYTDAELQAYKTYYAARNDSVGLAYTYANWSKTQGNKYDIELEKFKNLLRYVPSVKKKSVSDYYSFMLLLIQYYYISHDYHAIQHSLSVCDSIIDYGVRNNKPTLQFGAYLFKINFLLKNPQQRPLVHSYLKAVERLAMSKIQRAYYYYSLASYLREEKRYDESIQIYKKGYAQNPKIGSMNNQEFVFLFLAQVYRLKKDYKQAIKYSQKELNLLTNPYNSIAFDPITEVELRRWANQELALSYQKQGNYEQAAMHWYHFNLDADQVAALKTTYGDFSDWQTDIIELEFKQENEMFKLKQRMAYEESKLKSNQLNAAIIISLLSVLLTIILFFFYQQRMRMLQTQKKIALLQGQEIERDLIAKELHDDVGNTLAGIKAHLPTTIENYQKLSGWITDVYDKVRTLSHSLHTGVLHEEGLVQACHDFIDLIDKEQKIVVAVHGQPQPLPLFTSTMAFRIIQELLTNALRHAKANTIQLTLLFADKNLLISVEDDGVGFNASAQYPGVGLRSIKDRVATLGGQVEFNSTDQVGTTVLITLPLAF